MTDASVPAVPGPSVAIFVEPPEFVSDMQMATALRGLLRIDQGVMPDRVADALMVSGGAGDIGVVENQIEALYDWACLGDGPDDARRAAYGCASLFSKFSYGIMGKAASPDQPKRADGIRLELRRQMGDPSAAAAALEERPEPKGEFVPKPVVKTVSASVEDLIALIAGIDAVRAGLGSKLTKADAIDQLGELREAARAMAPADAPAEPAAA